MPIRSTADQLHNNDHRWGLFLVGSIISTFQLLFTLLVIQTLNADVLTLKKSRFKQDFLHIFSPSLIYFYNKMEQEEGLITPADPFDPDPQQVRKIVMKTKLTAI